MIASLVYLIFGFIDLLVILRFTFLILGANPASQFVSWIYSWSAPFVAPFNGIFGEHTATAVNGVVLKGVLDWGALVAIVVYTLIGSVIGQIVGRSRR